MPVITTNTAANTALRYLNKNSDSQADNLAKIASGSSITRASDDAAGLAIGTRLQTDVATLEQASTNAEHGSSILSVADGGMSSISDILSRMKTLATQATSGAVGATELTYIQAELDQLSDEIDGIATATNFNGESLLDGTSNFVTGTGVSFMVGTKSTDTITIEIDDVDASALGVSALDVTATGGAASAVDAIDSAIDSLSSARASVGAEMSRFDYRSAMLSTSKENVDAAQSAIMDADIADEQAELSSNEVLTQAAIAALATANQLPSSLLDLLR